MKQADTQEYPMSNPYSLSFFAGLLAFSGTSAARDIVWSQSWSDERPLTVAQASPMSGGLAVKTLDGSLVAFQHSREPVGVSPYRNPIVEETTLLGVDVDGNLLVDSSRTGTALVRPGQWSYATEGTGWQLASECSGTLFRGREFATLAADGRVLPRSRADIEIAGATGSRSGQGCRLFGTNSRGQGVLLLTGAGQEQRLRFRPLRWLGSWGAPITGGYGDIYLGEDSAGQRHYVSRAPDGTETAVPVQGENLGACVADGGPLQVYLVVHEQIDGTHRVRGFERMAFRWTQGITADTQLAGCALFRRSEGISEFQSINLDSGALGTVTPITDGGKACDVPAPSARLAVCGGLARSFTLGNSSVSFSEPLRYSAPSSRGYWVGAEETAPLVSLRLIERAGQLNARLDFLSPFTGAIQSSTPEQALGLPYDPSIAYFPVLNGPVETGSWFVSLQRSRLDQTLTRIPLIFREQSSAIPLRTASGAVAEVDATAMQSGRFAAIQTAASPGRLLEWTSADAIPRETPIGATPALGGMAGDVVLVNDANGTVRRLRALRDGSEIWSRVIASNCRTALPGDGFVYLFCPVDEVTRTTYTASRVAVLNGEVAWTRLVAGPNLNESSFARTATVGGGEIRILGSGGRGTGLFFASYARLRQSDGGILSIQQAPSDISFAAVSDPPDGIAALIGGISNYGRYVLRARPGDGIQNLPVAEYQNDLQDLWSNQGPRWYTSGRLLLRRTLEGRQRPFALVSGQVGIQIEPASTPVDGFQDYLIRLVGDVDRDVGRIELNVSADVAGVGIASITGCQSLRARYGNPTRIEVPTPASGCVFLVRTVSGHRLSGIGAGWYNTSVIQVSASQPYQFRAGAVYSSAEINTGLRDGFEN
jgi:hypothetical protein